MNVIRQAFLIGLLSVFASAAQAKDIAHDLHLSLDASLLSWTKRTADYNELFESSDNSLQLGFPTKLGARVGYAPLDLLEVGLRFAFDYTRYESRGDAVTTGVYELHAYARFVAPGDRLRFFVGPTIGANFGKNASEDSDEFAVKSRMFSIGVEAGVYGFVTDSFSIDPFLGFAYTTGSVDLDGFDARANNYGLASVQLTLGLALSGWVAL